jgi:biopolymer transport protein ExbD
MRRPIAHLELSPMIDTMASLTVMLFAMALWGTAAAVPVEQASGCNIGCGIGGEPGAPPLTIHFMQDQVWFGRKMEHGRVLPRSDGLVDVAVVDAMLRFDRFLYPREELVILNVDDGVAYGDMLTTLDRARRYGYDRPLLAGGPARER